MVVQMLLGQRHVFDGLGAGAWHEFHEPVDPKPAHRASLSARRLEFGFHELHDHADREEVGNVFDLGILGKLFGVGVGEAFRNSATPVGVRTPSLVSVRIGGGKVIREEFTARDLRR